MINYLFILRLCLGIFFGFTAVAATTAADIDVDLCKNVFVLFDLIDTFGYFNKLFVLFTRYSQQ